MRRLGHVCLVTAASSAALGFVPPMLQSHAPLHVLSTLSSVIVSLLAYAAVASGRISVRRLLALGLVYQVVLGFFVAVDFHSAAIAPSTGSRGWTPVAVWIMVFPRMIRLDWPHGRGHARHGRDGSVGAMGGAGRATRAGPISGALSFPPCSPP